MIYHEPVVTISAVRYMIGRNSYGVGVVCDYLKKIQSELSESNKQVIVRDIREHIDKYPDVKYRSDWEEIISLLEKDET